MVQGFSEKKKFIVAHLVKVVIRFYGAREFIIVLTEANH
jgi:hypothetical protein